MASNEQAKLTLGWIGGHMYWVGHTGTEDIIVECDTYERCAKEFLAGKGIERKTMDEHMRPGQEAWDRQCRIEEILQADMSFWRQVKGVKVVARRTAGKKE